MKKKWMFVLSMIGIFCISLQCVCALPVKEQKKQGKDISLRNEYHDQIHSFVHAYAHTPFVFVMDKDDTLTPASSPIEPASLKVLVDLLINDCFVVIITGASLDKTEPYVIEPVYKSLIETGHKDKLAFFRCYYVSGAEGIYYDAQGERKHYILKDEFSSAERYAIVHAFAQAFLEQVSVDFSIDLSSALQELTQAKDTEAIQTLFAKAMGSHEALLGHVSLKDTPRGLTLELRTSKEKKANECIANTPFTRKVRTRYEQYVKGKIRETAVIKHGPTFVNTNLVDKVTIVKDIPGLLGISQYALAVFGDSGTDYEMLGYEKQGLPKMAFFVGNPPKENEEQLPQGVMIWPVKGSLGTCAILQEFLQAFEEAKTQPLRQAA